MSALDPDGDAGKCHFFPFSLELLDFSGFCVHVWAWMCIVVIDDDGR